MNEASLEPLRELFCRLESALVLRRPLRIFIGGEAAAQIHCGMPVSSNVDIEFDSIQVAFPDLGRGSHPNLQLRRRPWNLTLIPSDYRSRAAPLVLGTRLLQPFVVSALDAAIGLVGQQNAESTIAALIRHQVISPSKFETCTRLVIDTELVGSVAAAKESLDRILQMLASKSHPI